MSHIIRGRGILAGGVARRSNSHYARSSRLAIQAPRSATYATHHASRGLAALPVDAVDVPVSGRRRRRVLHRCLDHRRAPGGEGRAERGTELVGRVDEHAVRAVALGDLREIGAIADAVRLEQAAELP